MVVITTKPLTRATKTTNNFIGHQENLIALTYGADLRPISLRRNNHAACTLYRLCNKSRNSMLAQFFYFLLKLARNFFPKFFRREIASLEIPERLINVNNIRDGQPALRVHCCHAAKTCSCHRAAVVGIFTADNDLFFRLSEALPIVTHHAHHGIVGFRA